VKQLEATPERHLVFVSYSPVHSEHQEWVYNEANVDSSKVVGTVDSRPKPTAVTQLLPGKEDLGGRAGYHAGSDLHLRRHRVRRGSSCTTQAMRIGPQMLLKVLLDMHEAAPDNHGESWRAPFAHAFRSTTDFSSMRRIGALSQSCLVKVAGKPI
jgi:hypothetical protein